MQNYFTLTLARSDTVRIDSRDRVPFSCSCQGTVFQLFFFPHMPLAFGLLFCC